jgi:hypothetical protein
MRVQVAGSPNPSFWVCLAMKVVVSIRVPFPHSTQGA